MVQALEASGAFRDPKVRRAFRAEPRERYVPEISPALDDLDVTIDYNNVKKRAGDTWRRWDTPEGALSLRRRGR
jgi:hypothetical protein